MFAEFILTAECYCLTILPTHFLPVSNDFYCFDTQSIKIKELLVAKNQCFNVSCEEVKKLHSAFLGYLNGMNNLEDLG
jgi:hypothetical protein